MENKIKVIVALLCVGIVFVGALTLFKRGSVSPPSAEAIQETTFWKYQCIDTMKTSRDKAAAWRNRPDLEEHIQKELQAVSEVGANCVALGTPYDDEFIPYLTVWVKEARRQNLHIWFRGNFSAWEGWFNYPGGMSAEELFVKTERFIEENSTLFEDGDIFTAAPEAENGGPFNQVEIDEHQAYREFLVKSHEISERAFDSIGKDVVINWFSMNGGLARRMMDAQTVNALDNTVTIDHYIKTADEMGEYVDYFNNTFGAQVVIGEFGAPIPEINGAMTDREQAEFVEDLLHELYVRRDVVSGINYWILYDGSTAILDANLERKPVFYAMEKYFKPATIRGVVTNRSGDPLDGVVVRLNDGDEVLTNEKGEYSLLAVEGKHVVQFGDNKKYQTTAKEVETERGEKTSLDAELAPVEVNILKRLWRFFFP